MVFTKLSDSDKSQLAIFAQEFDKKQLTEIRALIMRGSTPHDAKVLSEQRQTARRDLVNLLEEQNKQREPEVAPKAKPKARRAKKELSVVVDKDISSDEPPFSPTVCKKKPGKAKATMKQIEDDITNQIIILA